MNTPTTPPVTGATKYLFSIVMLRRDPRDEKAQAQWEEHIVAESWADALHYWRIEFADQATEVLSIKKQVPVVSIAPKEDRS